MIIFIKYNKKLLCRLTSKEIRNALLASIMIVIIVVLIRYSGLADYLTVEKLDKLKTDAETYGYMAHLIYTLINIVNAFVGFPVIIIKFMGGLVFGTFWGTLLTSIGSTLGAVLSFLSSRYIAKNFAKRMVQKSESLKKIYYGVEKNGWEMIMLTRLIPIFPYSFQNYVYGITDIKLTTYTLATFIFMLPSNFGITYLAEVTGNKKSILGAMAVYIIIAIIFGIIGLLISKDQTNKDSNNKDNL